MGSFEDVFRSSVLFGMIAKCLARQQDRLGNGVRVKTAPPFLHNGLPRNTGGYLFRDSSATVSGFPGMSAGRGRLQGRIQ